MRSIEPVFGGVATLDGVATIGIFGGTGALGSQFASVIVPHARKNSWRVILLSHSEESLLKCELLRSDLLANDVMEVMPMHERPTIDILVVTAGASTKSSPSVDKKHFLMTRNGDILSQVLQSVSFRAAVVATNPTTSLVQRSDRRFEGRIFGVGVENDTRRFQHVSGSNSYLIGAHAFEDLLLVNLSRETPSTSNNDFSQSQIDHFNRATYLAASAQEDELLRARNYEGLVQFFCSLPNEVRWWAQQRANSILNTSCHSAAKSIVSAVFALCGMCDNKAVVTLEAHLQINGTDCVVGWPFDQVNLKPLPVTLPEQSFTKLHQIALRYAT